MKDISREFSKKMAAALCLVLLLACSASAQCPILTMQSYVVYTNLTKYGFLSSDGGGYTNTHPPVVDVWHKQFVVSSDNYG